MITPQWYTYEFDLLKTHKELQESILKDIARRISETNMNITETAVWQAEMAQKTGLLYDDIIKEIAKRTGGTTAEIRQIFKDAKVEVFNYDNEMLLENGQNPETIKYISPKMQNVMKSALTKTSTEAKNLTKTTAITSQTAYLQACDLAHQKVASGAFAYQSAIKTAIKFAARQGVKVIYPSGHISSLDVAIRRSVLTGVNQTAGNLQNMRANELDCDIMEISAHSGARPSHALWQGQLVSRSGARGYLSLDDIGYGEVTGFMGANCRHNWYMYFGGMRMYSSEELNEMNNRTVKYDGEEYSEYEALQMQRKFERDIRKYKSELVMYDEAMKNIDGDVSEIKTEFNFTAQKLKAKERDLAEFCKQTELHRDRYREQVFSVKTENRIANFGRSVSGKTVWADRKALTKQKENDIIKIHQGRQNKHVQGTNNYIAGRSYLTISNEEIKSTIKNKSGTGKKAGNKEQIIADKIIGVNINTKHGFKTLTDTAHIHSSKEGYHLVPTHSQLRLKSIPQLKEYCKKMAIEYYDTPEYTKFLGKLTTQEKERRIDLLLSQKQSKTSLIKDIKSMEKKILKYRGDIK